MSRPQNILTTALSLTFFTFAYKSHVWDLVAIPAYYDGRNTTNNLYANYFLGFAFYPVGVFAGALASWPLSHKLGRKAVVLIAIAISAVTGIITTSTSQAIGLIVGYVLSGLASGMVQVTGLVWQTEVAAARQRGRRLVTLYVVGYAGAAFSSWMEYAFSGQPDYNIGARTPVALQFVFLVPATVLVCFSPDSWRSNLTSNFDRARSLLERTDPALASHLPAFKLHSRQTSTSPTLLTLCTSHPKGSFLSLRPYRRLLLIVLLQVAAIYSGSSTASTLLYRSTYYIFNTTDGNDSDDALPAALPTIVLVFAFLPLVLIDRHIRLLGGRRNLLIISSLGTAFCFLITIVISAAIEPHPANLRSYSYASATLSKVYFAFFLISMLFYQLGLGPIPDLYAAELAPGNCRVGVMAVSIAVSTAFSIMYQWLWGYMEGLGYYLFIIWMFIDILMATAVFLVYPETAGKSLESLDLYFARGLRVLVFRDREAISMKRGASEGEELEELHGYGEELDARRTSGANGQSEEHVVGLDQGK